jgi:hypothetical protein
LILDDDRLDSSIGRDINDDSSGWRRRLIDKVPGNEKCAQDVGLNASPPGRHRDIGERLIMFGLSSTIDLTH